MANRNALGDALGKVEGKLGGKVQGCALGLLIGLVDGDALCDTLREDEGDALGEVNVSLSTRLRSVQYDSS